MSMPPAHLYDFDPTHGLELSALCAIGPDASPPGFDEFWRRRYLRALQVDPAPQIRETASPDDRWRVHDLVYVSTDGFDIGGWLLLPRKGAVRRGLVVGHGYGGRDQPDFDIPVRDTAVLFPCFRGLSRSRRPPISDDRYGHVLNEILDPERFILGGCVEDLWLALSAGLRLFPELDGRIGYSGVSFGGGIGALGLAFDRRLDRGCLVVPTFGKMSLWLTLPSVGSARSAALLAGGPVSALAPNPDDRGGDSYAVPSRRPPNRFARQRGVYHAITQILAVEPRHGASPSQSHGKTRMSPTRGESPIESNESERALVACRCAPAQDVDVDSYDDHESDQDHLPEGADVVDVQAIAQEAHDEDAGENAENVAATAEERSPADDHRGDCIQFNSNSGVRETAAGSPHKEQPGDAGQKAADHVHEGEHAINIDARDAGRLRVAADCIEMTPDRNPRKKVSVRHGGDSDHYEACGHPCGRRENAEAPIGDAGVAYFGPDALDGGAACDEVGQAAGDIERAERHDEGVRKTQHS